MEKIDILTKIKQGDTSINSDELYNIVENNYFAEVGTIVERIRILANIKDNLYYEDTVMVLIKTILESTLITYYSLAQKISLLRHFADSGFLSTSEKMTEYFYTVLIGWIDWVPTFKLVDEQLVKSRLLQIVDMFDSEKELNIRIILFKRTNDASVLPNSIRDTFMF